MTQTFWTISNYEFAYAGYHRRTRRKLVRRGRTGAENAYCVVPGSPKCCIQAWFEPLRSGSEGTPYGKGAITHGIPEGISRRGELRGIFVQTSLAGCFGCPFWRRRRLAEQPRIHLRVLWLPSSVVHHGGHGDVSPPLACLCGSGCPFDGDAFQRHVGAAIGGSTRSPTYRTAWLLACCLMASIRHPASRGVVEVDQAEVPFREVDAFIEPGNAGKILVIACRGIDAKHAEPP